MYKYQTYEDIKATDEFKARWKALEDPETWDEYINWILGEVALCKEFYDKAPNVHSLPDGTLIKFDMSEVNSER